MLNNVVAIATRMSLTNFQEFYRHRIFEQDRTFIKITWVGTRFLGISR
jgi:hypothetical protein